MARIGLGAAATLHVPADFEFELDFWVGEGRASITLSPDRDQTPLRIGDLITKIAEMVGLSDQLGALTRLSQDPPWNAVFDVWVSPYLTLEVAEQPSVELVVKLFSDGGSTYGVKFPPGGLPPFLTFEPDFTVYELIVTYDKTKSGLDVRARISFKEQETAALGPGGDSPEKTEVVSYPFPVPDRGSSNFELLYFGLGQRFGPRVDVHAEDPLLEMFTDLEETFRSNNPEVVLEHLVKDYYDPTRGWFVAADMRAKGWRVMGVFNDPALYGLRVAGEKGSFEGFLFEILYQKLSPGLGVYYGALTLPEKYRQVQLGAASLTLPSFKIWVYTNGDFKVSVGWPLGDNSIGVEVYVFTGGGGFYFGKLRSADNPESGGKALVERLHAQGQTELEIDRYNPILVFGLGLWIGVGRSIRSGPFSASLSLTVQGTFEGILAWNESKGADLSSPPDYYWFAATVGIVGQLQGEVDLQVVKLSVLVRLSISAGLAFETDYGSVLVVTASVDVEASLKILFITITVGFHATIREEFTLAEGRNGNATLDGPRNPAFHGMNDWVVRGLDQLEAAVAAERYETARGARPAARPLPPVPTVPRTVRLHFVLQPGAVYPGNAPDKTVGIASLLVSAPRPNAATSQTEPTELESLLEAMCSWLLREWSEGTGEWQKVVEGLGQGGPPPKGWETALDLFLSKEIAFYVTGVSLAGEGNDELYVCAFPMFDDLQMTWTGSPAPVVFSRRANTYPNYLQVVDEYFAQLSLNQVSQNPDARGSGRFQATGRSGADLDPAGPSLTRFVFEDYFLTVARETARMMVDSGESSPTPAMAADIGGLGSRYLLNAMRLPDPSKTPAEPPIDMFKLDVEAGYALAGQQFEVAPSIETCDAVLSLGPEPWRVTSIHFDAGDSDKATATMRVEPPPPAPVPSWSDADHPGAAAGSIVLAATEPARRSDVWFAQRTRLPWRGAETTTYLVPLPTGASTWLGRGATNLSIRRTSETAGPVWPALLIDTRLNLVSRSLFNNVTVPSPSGEVDDSPAPAATSPYLPFVYGVDGTDDETRSKLEQLLGTPNALDGAEIHLLYDAETTGFESERLDPSAHLVGLFKTNLSTETQPGALARMRLLLEENPNGPVAGGIEHPAAFLRLLWEASVVRSPGFFLRYRTADGKDLPVGVFNPRGQSGPVAGVPATTSAPFTILVRFPAGSAFHSWHNGFQIDLEDTYNGSLFVGPEMNGAPMTVLGPSYPPGCLEFSAIWTEASALLDRSEGSVYDSDWIASLYHLMQFRVAPTGSADQPRFRPSLWSLALGPSRDRSSTPEQGAGVELTEEPQSYRQVVPAYLFAGDGTGEASPYAAVGGAPTLEFRINDTFGNPLSGSEHKRAFRLLYNDPLLLPQEWQGTRIAYRFLPRSSQGGSASFPRVRLRVGFDPRAVVPDRIGEMPIAIHGRALSARAATAEDKAKQQAEVALARYRLALLQLQDPRTTLTLSTSVLPSDGGRIGDGAEIKERLGSYVAAVCAELEKAVEDRGRPEPVHGTIDVEIDPTDLRNRNDDIFAVAVSLQLARPPDLVYRDRAGTTVANSVSNAGCVDADFEEAPGDAATTGSLPVGILQFAQDFEDTFSGFDGGTGAGRIAVRNQNADMASESSAPAIWAIRWSSSDGLHVHLPTTETPAAFFALAPLSVELMGGPALVPTYDSELKPTWSERTFSEVDIDAWASTFLGAVDRVLAPESAATISGVDARAYADVMFAKSVVAECVSLGVEPVYETTESPRVIPGDLVLARKQFKERLLSTLSSALSVSAIVQIPATVRVAGATVPGASAPRLYGALTMAREPSPVEGFTVAPAKLSLRQTSPAEPGYLTFLVSATHPAQVSTLSVKLQYNVRFVEHEIEEGEDQFGYVPSSWLRIALEHPDDPLLFKLAPVTAPVPSRQYPPMPRLVRQRAVQQDWAFSNRGSPIEPYLLWKYCLDLDVPAAQSQDEIWVEVRYNVPVALEAAGDPLRVLFQALASFNTAWPVLSAHLDLLQVGDDQQPSEPSKAAVIQAVVEQVKRVAAAWALYRGLPDPFPDTPRPPVSRGRLQSGPAVEAEQYVLDLSEVWTDHSLGVMTRAPLGSDDECHPELIQWPTINGKRPQGGPIPVCPSDPTKDCLAAPTGEPCWYVGSYELVPDPFGNQSLRLEWSPIDLLERQTASSATWRRRNARLSAPGDQLKTNPAFVYQTPVVSFQSSVVPSLVAPIVGPVDPGESLCKTMSDVLAPLAAAGIAATRERFVDVHVSYSFGLASNATTGVRIRSTAEVLLANNLRLLPDIGGEACNDQSPLPDPGQPLSLGELCRLVSDDCDSWFAFYSPATDDAVLRLSLVLFAIVEGAHLPVIELKGIDISVPSGWWPAL